MAQQSPQMHIVGAALSRWRAANRFSRERPDRPWNNRPGVFRPPSMRRFSLPFFRDLGACFSMRETAKNPEKQGKPVKFLVEGKIHKKLTFGSRPQQTGPRL